MNSQPNVIARQVTGMQRDVAFIVTETKHLISLSRLLPISVLALLVLPLFPLSASAEETREAESSASFSLRPVRYNPSQPDTGSYFIYDAHPGQVIQDEVRLVNAGSSEGTVRLYTVDATTGQTGGAVYRNAGDPQEQVGKWITWDGSELTLGPGEERIIPFTVTVPNNIRPGQHLGGLVAHNLAMTQGAQEGALQVNLETRSIVAVQLNLPGERVPHLTITGLHPDVQQGYQMLVLGLDNDGTEMLKPRGDITVYDDAGNEIQTIPLEIDTLLPATQIDYPVVVPGQALAPGAYRAVVRLADGDTHAEHEAAFEITEQQSQVVAEAAVAQQLPPASAANQGRIGGTSVRLMVPALMLVVVGVVIGIVFMIRQRQLR